MKVQINTANSFHLFGNIIRINVYGKGNSAANVIIGMQEEGDSPKSVKLFNKELIGILKEGMLVDVYGHFGSNSYVVNGETKYRDNNDIIADLIEIKESKKTTKQRETEKLYGLN